MGIKGFIFDLDGVIADTAEFHFEAWQRLAQRLGFDIDAQFNESLKGVGRMDSLNLILAHGGVSLTEAEKLKHAEEKNAEYIELISHMTPKDLLPGAHDALQRLREAGFKIALASASRNAPMILECLGVTELFDIVVDSGLIKNGKPDPEIFLSAAHQLGLQPSECIGVEDAVAGVQSIKSAGMFAVGIGQATVLHQADIVIGGLQDFDWLRIIAVRNGDV